MSSVIFTCLVPVIRAIPTSRKLARLANYTVQQNVTEMRGKLRETMMSGVNVGVLSISNQKAAPG